MDSLVQSILAGMAKIQEADLSEHQDALREIDSAVWALASDIEDDLLPCGCPRREVENIGHQEGCRESGA